LLQNWLPLNQEEELVVMELREDTLHKVLRLQASSSAWEEANM
jgi:hypothetical protein